MSTTINSLVILGWQATIEPVKLPQKRFDPKTGVPVPDVMVFDHFDLKIGNNVILQAEDEWEFGDKAKIPDMDIHRLNDGRVFVGKTLSKISDFGSGEMFIIGNITQIVGFREQASCPAQLFHIIYSS